MATVNCTVTENASQGWVRVEWEFTSSGEISPFPNQDDGEAFDCSGLDLNAVWPSGDFGGAFDNGKLDVTVSHLVSPADYFSLFAFDNSGADPQMQLSVAYLNQIKPVYNRNNRAVKLSVLFNRRGR